MCGETMFLNMMFCVSAHHTCENEMVCLCVHRDVAHVGIAAIKICDTCSAVPRRKSRICDDVVRTYQTHTLHAAVQHSFKKCPHTTCRAVNNICGDMVQCILDTQRLLSNKCVRPPSEKVCCICAICIDVPINKQRIDPQ